MRAYNFISHWQINAAPQKVEQALLHSEEWAHWWHGLDSVTPHGSTIETGAIYDCVFRSGVGYVLRITVTITDYQPGRSVSFTSVGDLEGEGSFGIDSASNTTTRVVIRWNADVTKPWMRLFSPFLRPLFVLMHHRLMKKGESGLNDYVQKT